MLEKTKTDVEKVVEMANDDKSGEGTVRFCKLAAGWRDDACKEAKTACDAAKKTWMIKNPGPTATRRKRYAGRKNRNIMRDVPKSNSK